MRIENQVCSLDLAKKLNELGVKQDSFLHWVKNSNDEYSLSAKITMDGYSIEVEGEKYSAFTVAELGELLPSKMNIDAFYKDLNLRIERDNNIHIVTYEANYYTILDYCAKDKNEANARAEMLIYLIENKLMELPDASI